MSFAFPKPQRARESQTNGGIKSQLAQANFCKEPVTLPPAPWEKEESTNDPQE